MRKIPTQTERRGIELAEQRSVERAGKRRDALALHKAGKTYDQIAEELSVGPKAAQTLVREAVKALTSELNEETLDERKAVALMQLNDLYVVASRERDMYLDETTLFRQTEGKEGKINSVEVLIDIQDHMLRIHTAKTKLLGLNAATKIEAKGAMVVGLAELQKIQEAIDANESPVIDLPPKSEA
jgi:predicted transcriptional regulator